MNRKFRIVVIGGAGASQQTLRGVLDEIPEAELVATIDSGEDGINRYSNLNPDVILVDMITDGISGLETARWIKEQSPEIRIILLSSKFNQDFLHAVVSMGFDGYLIKDITPTLMREALQSLCQRDRHIDRQKAR
jgi:DNA-binding NarL/FixJ family response regulator